MVSVYSFISAVLVFNLSLVLVFLLRRKTAFLVRYSVSVLFLITGLSLFRLFIPYDFPSAAVISSYKAFPAVVDFLTAPLQPGRPWLRPVVLLLLLWACGTLFFAARDVVRLIRSQRARRSYRLADRPEVQAAAAELGVAVPVAVTSSVTVPCAGGVFRPVIYFPDLPLSEEEIKFILLHEMQHIRGRDSLIKLLFTLLRAVFWWNPVAHLFLRDLCVMLEMRCDSKVTADMDERTRLRYLRSVLSFADRERGVPARGPAPSVSSAFSGEPSEVKQRFDVLFYMGRCRPRYIRSLVCGLVFLGFIGSYLVIVQPAWLPEEYLREGSEIYCIEFEGAYIEHTGGKYIVHLAEGPYTLQLREDLLCLPPFNEMTIIERNDAP